MSENVITVDIDCYREGKHDFSNCECQEPPGGSNGDDCIGKWKSGKATAEKNLKKAIAEVESKSEALKYAEEWEAKLKLYFDNIYTTAELADKVARELEAFKCQTQNVCKNAECTITALEILFCEVREIFEPCLRYLIELMDEVNACLKCITDPGLVRDEGILKVLAEYDMKLRELEGLQLDTLKKIIEALKCANILFYTICSIDEEENSSKAGKEVFICDSLQDELKLLCKTFGMDPEKVCAPNSSTPNDSKGEKEEGEEDNSYAHKVWECENLTKDCDDSNAEKLTLGPAPRFPLNCDPYYINTECQHGIAQDEKETKKAELSDAKKAKEAAQSCFDSLVLAIDTAESAKRGS